ncbi:MAG: hypothetical protein N2645_10885 [Clostridia bacterium]|nr:hypothetical protein [Clostridia bacterium]
MHFTPKEKKILALTGLILFTALYVNLFLRPQLKQIKNIRTEIAQYNDSYNKNLEYKYKVEGMESKLKILNEKLKKIRTLFPPVLNYEDILLSVRNIAWETGITIENYNFSDIAKIHEESSGKDENGEGGGEAIQEQNEVMNEDLKKMLENLSGSHALNKDEKKNEDNKVQNGKGYSVSLKMNIKGTNKQMKEFLSQVTRLENKVFCRELQITNSGNEVLNIDMTLDFCGIMEQNSKDYVIASAGAWKPLQSTGKDDMFRPFANYKGPFNEEKAGQQDQKPPITVEELERVDFTVRVMPYGNNMAPPTVTMVGKSIVPGALNGLSVPMVYGDSREEEKAELFIEEKAGKFYCKFRTDHEAFPDHEFTKTAEFKPKGQDILVLIDSTERKSKQDKSSINIHITNKSSKKLKMKVINEDKSNPRVKLDTNPNEKVEIIYAP